MAAKYKTPGVYVEEVSKFPPSIAQVETAIPAFIGYTQFALKKGASITGTPTRISSLLEYETYFGSAKAETSIAVTVNDVIVTGTMKRTIIPAQPFSPSPYLMYYAMQLYFANGGGPCYIVSVNDYDTGGANNVLFDDLADGLDALRKKDGPTLLLFPDAKILDEVAFYTLYQNALVQCHDLQDRFTILDTHSSDDVESDSFALRNRISLGKDYLKYGAAYYPHLETILNFHYDEATVAITHNSEDSQALAEEIRITNLAASEITGLQTGSTTLVTELSKANVLLQAMTTENALTNSNTIASPLQALVDILNDAINKGNNAVTAGNTAATAADENATIAATATAAADAVNTALTAIEQPLPSLIKALKGHITTIQEAGDGTTVKNESTLALATVAEINPALQSVIDLIGPVLIDAIAAAQDVDTNGALDGMMLSAIERIDNAAYNAIKTAIRTLPVSMPPSSAIAGIYARVDSDRGVWKAPANVGVNYVVQPVIKITHEEQNELNVHPTGKSINAIRSFTGRGILVWGARTLAGNDNEWKYVPVCRFFNMVEESVKKATKRFVFEPNDANTWVSVRTMIENFLILQWKAGALAGAKPSQAFYVRIGLGETMTPEDILNRNMIVEIGMAVVRPAEFIVLKFSHKMQKA